MEEIIKIQNLSKSFGDVKAVRGISFEVREGLPSLVREGGE